MWKAGTDKNGYGVFAVNLSTNSAHRVAYEWTYGRIPKGKFVMHTCGNRACCNPAHLYLGTNADRVRGRTTNRPPRSTLPKEQIELEVRSQWLGKELDQSKLSMKYGLTKKQIRKICQCFDDWE
jgi:hypothetical protein